MTGIRFRIVACALLAVSAVAVYFPVFSNTFAWDDEYLVLKNPAIQKVSSIPGFFVQSWAQGVDYKLGADQNKPYFRPMALTSMTLDWAVAGPDKLVFHTTNLLIHVAAAFFLFLWLLKVFEGFTATAASGSTASTSASAGSSTGASGGSRACSRKIAAPLLAAFAGALFWVVHPVSTEAVNLVSYRTSLISGLTIFASLWLLTPRTPVPGNADARGRTGLAAIVIAALMFGAGLLSKETTLVMPGLLFVMDLSAGRFNIRRFARVYLPLGLVGLLWLIARSQFTGAGVYTWFEGLSVWQSFLMVGRIFYLYIRLIFLPWPLCPFYDWGILGAPKSILEPDIAAGFLLLAIIVVTAVLTWKRNRLVSSGLFFFLMALLPVSHIIPFFDAAGERFMYVPLAGAAVALFGAAMTVPSRPRQKWTTAILAAVMIVSFMPQTYDRSTQWKNSETMLRVTSRDFPTSISAHLGLARLLLEKKRPAEALVPLKQVVELAPSLAVGHALLAVAQARTGDIIGARMTLRTSPMPAGGEISTVELTRTELLKANQADLARRLGLMGP